MRVTCLLIVKRLFCQNECALELIGQVCVIPDPDRFFSQLELLTMSLPIVGHMYADVSELAIP